VDVELGDDARTFLQETRFGVLATVNADGSPQQTVMWYELRGDTIVMNTKRGRQKDRNLHRDPRASLCVEEGYRYVTLTGTISTNDDQVVAQADIAALARRYHGPEKGDEMARDEFSRQERVTLTLQIERVETHGLSGEE
jgi:PPOX class probable F420-dependent enzyme